MNADWASTSRAATRTPSIIHVEALVRDVCDELQGRAERAGTRIVVECRGGFMMGNAAALHDTLFDLVNGAIEATPPGRDVHLETRMTAEGDQLWTIRDAGTATLEGVMRCASIAMSHGGSLVFESREGEGTMVRVWLPREGRRRDVLTVVSPHRRNGNVVYLRDRE
jgi:signal transduction histidine kinase